MSQTDSTKGSHCIRYSPTCNWQPCFPDSSGALIGFYQLHVDFFRDVCHSHDPIVVKIRLLYFAVFEGNKLKTAAHQLHVRKYKEVAQEIVDAARGGVPDPVEAGVKAHKQAEQEIEEAKPMSKEERQQRKIQEFFDSDWGPMIEEQEARMQEERDAVERARRGGFWCG